MGKTVDKEYKIYMKCVKKNFLKNKNLDSNKNILFAEIGIKSGAKLPL